jgi:hypothetical protein
MPGAVPRKVILFRIEGFKSSRPFDYSMAENTHPVTVDTVDVEANKTKYAERDSLAEWKYRRLSVSLSHKEDFETKIMLN